MFKDRIFKSAKFDKPWRDLPWGDNQEGFHYVKSYKPHSDASCLRVLLYGPPGSGKSSFINSVDSTLQRRISTRASAAAHFNEGSFTSRYRSYLIQKDSPTSHYPFVFSDTTGIERGSGRGVDLEKLKLIMKGHVNDGCKLLPGSSPSEYNKTPTIRDRVHVLVCIVPATTSNLMDDDSVHKIKEIRREAEDLGISQMAIVTKIDEACPKVKKNIRNVYKSKLLKEQMDKVSGALGIPMNCIFPVQNYSKETRTEPDIDTLILDAMRAIINFGDDNLNDIVARGASGGFEEHHGVPQPQKQEKKKKTIPKQ